MLDPRYTLSLLTLSLGTLVAAAGCTTVGVQLAHTEIHHPGQELFNGYTKPNVGCYFCHNGNGRGSDKGPDLSTKVSKMSDEQILAIITNGEKGKMPGFADRTTDEERHTILAWLREAFGQQDPNAAPHHHESDGDEAPDKPAAEDSGT